MATPLDGGGLELWASSSRSVPVSRAATGGVVKLRIGRPERDDAPQQLRRSEIVRGADRGGHVRRNAPDPARVGAPWCLRRTRGATGQRSRSNLTPTFLPLHHGNTASSA